MTLIMVNKTDFTIQDLINEAVRQDRKNVKQSFWHPSALGSCLTGAYLIRKGIAEKKFDDRTLRVFNVGRMFEDWLSTLLIKQDVDFRTQIGLGGKIENETLVPSEKKESEIAGYADLMINGVVYEIKSKHSRGLQYTPNYHHKLQLWTYLKCLGKPEGRLLYLSKDDLRVKEYSVFLNDEGLEAEVVRELKVLNEAWKQGLPPQPVEDKKDWRYKYCNIHEEYCLKQPEYLKGQE